MRSLTAPAVLAVALLSNLAQPLEAQSFAVGVGGGAVTTSGSGANLTGFKTGGGYAFGEVALEDAIVLQTRFSFFEMTGSAPNAPHVQVNSGTVTVAYLFKEQWWSGGFFAGLGYYGLSPNSPGADEVAVDQSETVFGWTGGIMTTFQLSRRWDLRIEGVGSLLRDENSSIPIMVSAAVGYHF